MSLINEGNMVCKENVVQKGYKTICLDLVIDIKKLETNMKYYCKETQKSNNKTHQEVPNKNNTTFIFGDSFKDDLPLP